MLLLCGAPAAAQQQSSSGEAGADGAAGAPGEAGENGEEGGDASVLLFGGPDQEASAFGGRGGDGGSGGGQAAGVTPGAGGAGGQGGNAFGGPDSTSTAGRGARAVAVMVGGDGGNGGDGAGGGGDGGHGGDAHALAHGSALNSLGFDVSGSATGGDGGDGGSSHDAAHAGGSGGDGGHATTRVSSYTRAASGELLAGTAIGGDGGIGRGEGASGGWGGGVTINAEVDVAKLTPGTSGVDVRVELEGRAGTGGAGVDGADGGNGTRTRLIDIVGGQANAFQDTGPRSLSIEVVGHGGEAGKSDSGSGGKGGDAIVEQSYGGPDNQHAWDVTSVAHAGDGGTSTTGTDGDGGNAVAWVEVTSETEVPGSFNPGNRALAQAFGGAGAIAGAAQATARAESQERHSEANAEASAGMAFGTGLLTGDSDALAEAKGTSAAARAIATGSEGEARARAISWAPGAVQILAEASAPVLTGAVAEAFVFDPPVADLISTPPDVDAAIRVTGEGPDSIGGVEMQLVQRQELDGESILLASFIQLAFGEGSEAQLSDLSLEFTPGGASSNGFAALHFRIDADGESLLDTTFDTEADALDFFTEAFNLGVLGNPEDILEELSVTLELEATEAGQGFDLGFTLVLAPEPRSAALLALGLSFLARRRRLAA